jgi:hypothetical protein
MFQHFPSFYAAMYVIAISQANPRKKSDKLSKEVMLKISYA